MKRKWPILALCAAPAAVALLLGLAAEDARQANLLDLQTLRAASRALRAEAEEERLARDRAAEQEVRQAAREADEAWVTHDNLIAEQARRDQSWHARLLREIRRRAGW